MNATLSQKTQGVNAPDNTTENVHLYMNQLKTQTCTEIASNDFGLPCGPKVLEREREREEEEEGMVLTWWW